MNAAVNPSAAGDEVGANAISPLHGEAGIPDVDRASRSALSGKGLLAVGLLMAMVCVFIGYGIHRFADSGRKDEEASKRVGDRPAAATREPRTLDMPLTKWPEIAVVQPRIPAIQPSDAESAEPIGVRRTGTGTPKGTTHGTKSISPEDAPVLLVTTRPGAGHSTATRPGGPEGRGNGGSALESSLGGTPDGAPSADSRDALSSTARNLTAYQQQLQGLLDSLTKTAVQASGQAAGTTPVGASSLGVPSSGGSPLGGMGASPFGGTRTGETASGASSSTPSGALFGGQLQASATPRVAASNLAPHPEARSLTLPKGTAFTCALKTKVVSAVSGLVGCQVQRNVYGDDGRVLLIERGSHLDGEYRILNVRPGAVRIPVLWTRIRTPLGVTVDIDSPATGALGESGIDGTVDNRWVERIGAAMLLSLIDDSVKLVIQNQSNDTSGNGTVVLPSTTGNTSKLAEKVLDSTINIPPLVSRNQGGIVGIYVARDVDFSSVYSLEPRPLQAATINPSEVPGAAGESMR